MAMTFFTRILGSPRRAGSLLAAAFLCASPCSHAGGPEHGQTNFAPPAPVPVNVPVIAKEAVAPVQTNTEQSAADTMRMKSEIPPSANIKSEAEQTTSVQMRDYALKLGLARSERRSADFAKAEADYLFIINSNASDNMKKVALSELAASCEESKQFVKAQKVYAQWTRQFPEDPGMLEILLRQGLLYREMGSSGMALTKFYTVMSTALSLKVDQMDYYKRLVLRAQTEVAETYYLDGKYSDAADKLKLLLKLETTDLNREVVLFKLIRCLYKLETYPEAVAKAQTFLNDFPDSPNQAEARFLLASSLKKIGRTSDSLEQVSLLLQSQQKTAAADPDNWRYWQQRTGNEIANMLYQEGDFVNSLQVYTRLAELDSSPKWQLPVLYQVGLVYEQLKQPEKALGVYERILSHAKDPGIESLSAVKTVIDMAGWRQNRLTWQAKAEKVERDLGTATPEPAATNTP